ncbi:MAG TPA: hypothetical protein VEX64_08145 [Pyrinomonadaceae bacterium]|jgi:hypothetical protein|nr:hypothetical protein [Pyrinomonadaceae bacterium]
MEIIKQQTIASVELAEARLSLDELIVYEAALSFGLEKLTDLEMMNRFGATREETEGILEDVREAISICKSTTLIAA